ncbi:MAG: hypothetical protein E6J02_12985 [Chloroflexi bacterium]|nr:MAG: hypothetical protein E6J02_12985 [Chloroflexota bacterium]
MNLQKRAARVGFDYGGAEAAAANVAEEARELAVAAEGDELFREMGDLLFALVSVARKRKVNPEDALRAAGQRFKRRFQALEAAAQEQGLPLRELDRAALEALWADSS